MSEDAGRKKDRAEMTFGELLAWHLENGTRPGLDPSKPGLTWDKPEFHTAAHVEERAFNYWLSDSHLPRNTHAAEKALFGDSEEVGPWRIELREALKRTKAMSREQRIAARNGQTTSAQASEPTEDATLEGDPFGEKKAENEARNKVDEEEPRAETDNEREFYASVPGTSFEEARDGGRWFTPRSRNAASVIASLSIFMAIVSASITTPQAPSRPAASGMASRTPAPPTPVPVPAAENPKPVVVTPAPTPAGPLKTAMGSASTEPPTVAVPQAPAASPMPEANPPPHAAPVVEVPDPAALALQKTIDALKAAHDAGVKADEEKARQRDKAGSDNRDAEIARAAYTREIAGLGFRVRENTAVRGQNLGYVNAKSIADCALACISANCDAFDYYKDRSPNAAQTGAICNRYVKPFYEEAHGDYTAGVRVSELKLDQRTQSSLPEGSEGRVKLAQAGSASTLPAQEDDLTRCANGPVKVTGFGLKCDWILGGGTAPGGQERFAVSTINECAAKCRSNRSCTGFTFNSSDPEGRRACQVFGGRPEGRESNGWVSGTR